MTQTATTGSFVDHFTDVAKRLASSGPAWLRAARLDAMSRFDSRGFPGPREEEWRTTNVAPIVTGGFRPAPEGRTIASTALPELARLELGGPRLVFLDGRLVAGLSSDSGEHGGAWVLSLAEALEKVPERIEAHLRATSSTEGTVFRDLNAALAEDGALIAVPDGVEVAAPIQLLFLSTGASPTAAFPRTLIAAGRSSRVRVVETYLGLQDGTYLTNAATETFVDDGATVEVFRVQLESPGAFHVSSNFSRQRRDSKFVHHNINLGARLARHDLTSVLDGEGAHCHLQGLYLTSESQQVDNHTVLDHAQPHGDSREVYKGILAGNSRSTFNGRIIVREDAQKTDAKQSNPNLLLSRGALAHTRPQLEIYADDVKCTHGATIGCLDDDAIFYLQSRGIPHREARDLLIDAFAGEILEQLEIDPLRELLTRHVTERLASAE